MAQDTTMTGKVLKRFRSFRYTLVLEGILVGIAAGLVTVLFRIVLEKADLLRQGAGKYIGENSWFFPARNACSASSRVAVKKFSLSCAGGRV